MTAQPIAAEAYSRALINILEDSAEEQARLADTQRATLNILEDFSESAEQLRLANHELTELDSLKSEFVAMASHELRTPLTSITGFSSTMLNMWPTICDDDKLAFVKIIDRQSQRLSRLVENLLTLTRIESGPLHCTTSQIEVASVVEQVLLELDAAHVKMTCSPEVYVVVDHDHLVQIILNLVANAIAHGSTPITVDATVETESVRIDVRDSGAGVPDPFVPHLFERFAQASRDQSRSATGDDGRGTGLGLSIVHALAAAHGGAAWHEPNQPTGACFSVRLPRASRPAVP